VLIHGRFDLRSPLDTAWQLAQAWPDAQLKVVETGHTGGDEMTAAMVEATNHFARLAWSKPSQIIASTAGEDLANASANNELGRAWMPMELAARSRRATRSGWHW
jgi:hypothetical protein